jgi:malonate transporter and related proteins
VAGLTDAVSEALSRSDRFSLDIAGGRKQCAGLAWALGLKKMQIADLILPVFAVIVTGWLAGYLGYVARDLSDALIHVAYHVARPALLRVTLAHEPARSLLAWRFLVAFGGGSLLCFAIVFASRRAFGGQGLAGAAMQGWAASMTNTGFVALPVLQATYGA